MTISKNFIKLPIGELIPYENNPRFNDPVMMAQIASEVYAQWSSE